MTFSFTKYSWEKGAIWLQHLLSIVFMFGIKKARWSLIIKTRRTGGENSQANLILAIYSWSDGPPTRDEIRYALKKLKNYKSPGMDGITNEQLKYGESALVHQLGHLFTKVWEDKVIPEDLLGGSCCHNWEKRRYFLLQ